MKSFATVIFTLGPVPWKSLRSVFVRCDLAAYAKKGRDPVGVYILRLEEGSEQHTCLVGSLAELGLSWRTHRENVYSEAELRGAPLLRLVIARSPRGMGGPQHGTEYDLSSACPSCGTGARQVSPLVLSMSGVSRRAPIFETPRGEILVGEDVKRTIEAIDPSGLELREAIGLRGTGLRYFQLLAAHEMPPMKPSTEGLLRDEPCAGCSRNGYFGDLEHPMRIRYREEDLDATDSDAHFTYEWFGYSKLRTPFAESLLAYPLLLISSRMYEVFADDRLRGVKFEPVDVA